MCGGRNFGEFLTTRGEERERSLVIVERKLFNLMMLFYKPSSIVQGGASGGDHMARLWADKNGVPHTGMKYAIMDWYTNGELDRSLGPKRNARMLKENKDIELTIAFDGGKGTANMISLSKRSGVPVIEPKIIDR